MKRKQYITVAWTIGIVLIIDQLVKILVKTNMQIGEEIPLIGDWCLLHFVENEGMAFGMAFGGQFGKLVLSLFRLVASAAILWYVLRCIKKGARTAFVVSLALIFAGAIGNLIDSCFYGLIFSESYYHVAEFMPAAGGYAGMFYGRVVDMFYFPLIDTVWPEWLPLVGGNRFVFFNAIFNVADASITIGVAVLLIDQLFFAKKDCKSEESQCDVAGEQK